MRSKMEIKEKCTEENRSRKGGGEIEIKTFFYLFFSCFGMCRSHVFDQKKHFYGEFLGLNIRPITILATFSKVSGRYKDMKSNSLHRDVAFPHC